MNSPLIKTLLQFLAGLAGGGVLGAIGGFAGNALGRGTIPGGFGDLVGTILLAGAGFMVGAGLGAHFAGKRLGMSTAWLLAIAGSFAAGIVVLLLAEPLRLNSSPEFLWEAFAVAVPLAAVFVPRLFIRR